MITKTSLKELLTALNFSEKNKVWEKEVNGFKFTVDFEKGILGYPKGVTINDKTTSNFDKPENFVVFECVHRLIEKGYRPEHIELEKKRTLGHDAKGGKADICVEDEDENMLLIIECKTAGKEYNKAWKDTKVDGGQIFSYWQQERGTKWISLYTSDVNDEGEIIYTNDIINCSDDANMLLVAKNDDSIKLYKNARTAEELFEVWDETYTKQSFSGLIFGEDTQAYKIGVKPLRKKDLKDFSTDDKIVNKFEEILRHNNVSDKENAFNRLIALFIGKLYDEITKRDNDEVEFQYKVGSDTYESLQDRLQRLHHDGMKKFMEEEISYIENDYAEKLFANKLDGEQRKAAIEDLKNTIRVLKFYSNNDFSFKDVHNEELFLQNGKVLVEVVQLFEPYRIVYSGKQQFLGDLFEQLLNKGFKQNEGQFFTPMPITRYIRDCLPLDKIIFKEGNYTLPKVVDYACGAGHFLTEAVESINDYFKNIGNEEIIKENNWVRDSIFGIEKDYRLARVAKVSLYMNGAGKGNIIFGDGLEQYKDKGIENGTFDVLVANPPYSVSSFKEHLKLKNNELGILKYVSNDGGEIETAFIERIAQLLKPNGIAAVILPSSILSNGKESYVNARKILLKNFYIRAITQFGGKTFSATQTNTVVLFLEKYDEPPKHYKMVQDSVDAIFSGSETGREDETIFSAYLENIGVSLEDYKKFIEEEFSFEEMENIEHFAEYVKNFKQKKEAEQRNSNKIFYKKYKELEKDKLYYFALVYNQSTLIITSPSDNNEQKIFLGYEWSNRKGSEGIQITNPGGMMYDDENRQSENTLAAAIRDSFIDHQLELEELTKYYQYCRLQDLLDFSRFDFDKNIKTSPAINFKVESKYELETIDNITGGHIEAGSRPEGGVGLISSGALSLGGEHIDNTSGYLKLTSPKYVPLDYYKSAEKGKIAKNDILLCKDGAQTGKIAIVRNELDGKDAMVNEHVFILRCNDPITQKYLFTFLYGNTGQKLLKYSITGAAQGGLNSTNLKAIKIPLPPKKIQKKIIQECSKIDEEYNTSRMTIEEYKNKIGEIFKNLEIVKGGGRIVRLKDLCETNPSKSVLQNIPGDTLVSFIEMASVSNDGYIESMQDRELDELRKGSYTYFAENDIIIAKITPCMENGKCAIAKGLTNGIGMGSSEFHVIHTNKGILTEYLFGYLNREDIRLQAAKSMTGASGHRRVPITFYENLNIPVPTIQQQKSIISEIEKYENKIKIAKEVIESCSARKQAILDKYLI